MENQIYIHGIPKGVNENEVIKLRSRLIRDVGGFIQKNRIENLSINFGKNAMSDKNITPPEGRPQGSSDLEELIEKRALQYSSQQPIYRFSHLIVPDQLQDDLLSAIDSISVEKIIFDAWGLRDIQPNPRTTLNFYGPPGTGKTLAAHAIASYLEKPILLASYADIESKFHGDGPKNLKAIFYAAERDQALLFIDEADSLLSKRLTRVNTGSEQAINSMRSQLLICLEQFKGIVVFATNLIENYDNAFETRVRHIYFSMPDMATRLKIWERHLPQKLPLSQDVSLKSLADVDNVCGRDIREAVIDASSKAALRAMSQGKRPDQGLVTGQDLMSAILRKKDSRIKETVNDSIGMVENAIKEQLQITPSNTL